MFLRRTTAPSRKKGQKYHYVHLVESYRRESDGRPTHRIVANLGQLDDVTFENLRLALRASKQGKRVAVVKLPAGRDAAPKPQANLRFLDIAVARELWEQTGLAQALKEALPATGALVAEALVAEALVLQRLVEPDSKLAAVRWYPHTALPELQGLSPEQFNNSRVHRTLDGLEAVTPALIAKLPSLFLRPGGSPVSMYLDVTDASFVGRGPEMAEVGKNKTGQIRRKVGIVLLCDERGYPLRWQVIRGNRTDGDAMLEMLSEIQSLEWTGSAPIVMDRAMGRTAYIRTMLDRGVPFLTGLARTEYATYAPGLPWQQMQDLELDAKGPSVPPKSAVLELVKEATQRAEMAGLERVNDRMFVMDCGIVAPDRDARLDAIEEDWEGLDPVIRALRLSMKLRQLVADGLFDSQAAAARALGMSKALATKYVRLLTLSEEIRADILEGQVEGWPLATFLQLARVKNKEKQLARFEELRNSGGPPLNKSVRTAPTTSNPEESNSSAPRVRVVAVFNPQHLADDRCKARRRQESIKQYAQQLNRKLASPTSNHTPQKILSMVESRLRRDSLVTKYDVEVYSEQSPGGRKQHRVRVEPRQEEWQLARRYDGFSVLVAPPTVSSSAESIATLYRAKDMVEKDFKVIKSVTDLAPVRHRTDPKVDAHVTLCMLALLLERTMRDRLEGMCTAETAIELLGYCCLNSYRSEGGPNVYTVTEPDKDQAALLRKLRLSHLADDDCVAGQLQPRQ